MTEFDLSFTFSKDLSENIENDELFHLRHMIAHALRNAGFGEIIVEAEDRFRNTHATPLNDMYYVPENHLFINFSWGYPLIHGDIVNLISEGIPMIVNTAWMHYNIHTIARSVILHVNHVLLPGDNNNLN